MLRAHGPDCKASWHARRRSVRGLLPASSAQVCLACCSGTDIGGTAGFASIIGLLLQVMLVVIVARLIFVWWQRRNMPAPAYAPRYNIAPTVSGHHLAVNRLVAGSNPAQGANKINELSKVFQLKNLPKSVWGNIWGNNLQISSPRRSRGRPCCHCGGVSGVAVGVN
jgi:hypothetical protein